MNEPTQQQINSACMSYRHDFGLLSELEKAQVRAEAREWLRAWHKEGLAAQQDGAREALSLARAYVYAATAFPSSAADAQRLVNIIDKLLGGLEQAGERG